MGKQLRVKEASEMLGVAKGTLRHYADKGVINCHTLPSGHRYFDEDDLMSFLNKKSNNNKEEKSQQTKVYIYSRVSTKKQADSGNLDRQVTRLVEYAIIKKYQIEKIYKEVASGINENRKELNKLLNDLKNEKNTIVLIEYKDRLARFGYHYIEKYIHDFGNAIEIVEEIEKDDEKELVDDWMAITTSFSARIYGNRGGKKISDAINKVVITAKKEE